MSLSLQVSRIATMVLALAVAFLAGPDVDGGLAHAGGGGQTDEKQAFEAAKELGTIDAWDAFIRNYPNGFHADLARAYSKKLRDHGQTTVPTPLPQPAQTAPVTATPPSVPPATLMAMPSGPAIELSCSQASRMKSERTGEAAKIRFINESGGTIVLQWIDFDGALKEYGEIQPGAELIQNTFISHPWIAAYQEGSCKQLFLPGSGTTIARVVAESDARPAPAPSQKSSSSKSSSAQTKRKPSTATPSKKTVERRAKASCEELGMIYLNGTCQPKKKSERATAEKKKNKPCPAGMYRNPYGVCQPNETGG